MNISPYAATWRDGAGEVVSTVYGGFACLRPIEPRNFAARSEDEKYECTFRCRDCAGCRNLERHWLQLRLVEGAKEWGEQLTTVELAPSQAQTVPTSSSIQRTSSICGAMGWIRNGQDSSVLIVEGDPKQLRATLTAYGISAGVREIKGRERLRAWRKATRGMLVARDELGAQTNRWYIRGLPKLEHDPMRLEKRGGIRKRHPEARAGVLAWRDGLTLYPCAIQRGREVITSLLAQSAARSSRFAVNRRRPVRAGVLLTAQVVSARALSTAPKTIPYSYKVSRDVSSRLGSPFDFSAWAEKMSKIARERGDSS